MKSIKYSIGILFVVVLFSGCAQKPAPGPTVSRDRAPGSQPTITEQSLEPRDAELKPEPQPIASPVVVPPAPDQSSLLPIGYVNDRIFEYGRKLEQWKELDDQSLLLQIDERQTETMVRCFRDLQKVLGGYQSMRDTILQRNVLTSTDPLGPDEVLELQRQDIAFLEGICGRLLGEAHDKDAGWQQRREGADLNQLETLIERYSANGEYNEVVQVWQSIPAQQIDRVDLKTKILYGNALMFLDQPQKAAEIYQQIVDAMSVSREQPTDLISLRKVLADLYTAYGNYPAAEKQYDLISSDYQSIGKIEQWANLQLSILERSAAGSPELTEFSRLLRNYLGYQPKRDGYSLVWQADEFLGNYPYSPVSSNVDVIREDALQRADAWFNGLLSGVDELAAEKKFQDAMESLQKIPEDIVGDQRFQAVQEKLDSIILSEAVERETAKIQQMQDLQRRWNDGMLLADEEDFAGAVEVFTSLLDSEFGPRAEEKIKELSLKAAMNERRKAADLFVRFSKTTDLESKKRLLVESRRVLKDILVAYPEVEIADKVVGNIRRVEQEMNDLDPLLLPAVEEQERRQALQQTHVTEPVGVDVFDLPFSPEASMEPSSGQPLPVRMPDQVQ